MIADKAGLVQIEYFGLQRFLTLSEEWIFVSEDIPLGEQGTLGKLRLKLRYFCLDPLSSLTDKKAIQIMCNEVLLKF